MPLLVLPWLKARNWGFPSLVIGVAFLTAVLGAFLFCEALGRLGLHSMVGLFGIFNLRSCRYPITVFRTELARKLSGWIVITYH